MQAEQSAVAFSSMGYDDTPKLDDEYVGCHQGGERELWATVILFAINDYENLCQQIETAWRLTQRPVSRHLDISRENIKGQVDHTWFGLICLLIDVSPDHIKRRLRELDVEYCIASIPIESADVEVESPFHQHYVKYIKPKRMLS